MKPLIVEEAAELELIGSVAFYEERKTGSWLRSKCGGSHLGCSFDLTKGNEGNKDYAARISASLTLLSSVENLRVDSCPFVVTIDCR